MPMQMVRIRHMRMHVTQWLMPMPVAMLLCRHGVMGVQVVPISMRMGVLMFERFVCVLMTMGLK